MNLLKYFILVIVVFMVSCLNCNSLSVSGKLKTSNIDIGKNQNIPIINMIIISIILGCYSGNLGVAEGLTDRISYIQDFLVRCPAYMKSLNDFINAQIEWGYILLNILIRMFTDDTYWLFFYVVMISSFITLYSIIKISGNYEISVLLFMISSCFFNEIFLIKQSLAVAFSGLALVSYLNGNKINYFILSTIACMFHSTAIILFPMYFIYKKEHSKKFYIIIAFATGIILVFFNEVFYMLGKIEFLNQFMDFESLATHSIKSNIFVVFKGIPFYIITFLGWVNRDKFKINIKNYEIYMTSSILCCVGWILSYNMYWLFRISWYFTIPTIVFGIQIIKSISDKRGKFINLMIIYGIMFCLTIREVYLILDC